MARPSKHDGVLYKRAGSTIWWMRYRDKSGARILESTCCQDWQEAQRKMRERLQARDQNGLPIVRRGEQMLFGDWADFFVEHYSIPPIREVSTHEANLTALKHLRPLLGAKKLSDITGDEIENYL